MVNDGSTDPAATVFLADLRDSRLTVLNRQRQPGDIRTASNALNYGFDYALSHGAKSLTYVHSDDLLTRDSLEGRLQAMQDKDMVFGRMAYCSKQGVYEHEVGEFIDPVYARYTCFPHHTSMWSREMIEALKRNRGTLFDPKVSFGEDLDVTLSSMNLVHNSGYRLQFVDGLFYIHLQTPNNITATTQRPEVDRQLQYVFDKNNYHQRVRIKRLISRFFRSPGFFLPEAIRKQVRPYKKTMSDMTGGFLFPDTAQQVDVDLYWFKDVLPRLGFSVNL